MDKKKVIDHFKDKKNQRKLLELHDGSNVVGTEADEQNHLWYVIDRGGELVLERAENQKVSSIFNSNDFSTVTVKQLPSPKIDKVKPG